MVNRRLLTMIIAVGIATFATTSASAAVQTKRLWGNNRYETGSAIVQQGWQSTSYYAVIVNGENFPDALSAAPLAQKNHAPILLTQKDTLDSNTAEQLKRLDVKKVFIVGGEGVVRPSVEKAINQLGIQTERYKGEDRDETAVNVASQIGTKNGIIVTIDNDYTDALSAAPIAANLEMPIILVSKNSITSSLKNFIFMNYIPKTYVLGDTDIIGDGVASLFPNVQRITGKDKYERNINIIKAFEDKLDFSNVCVAYSEQFADALSGSVFAASNKNPIILAGDQLTDSTSSFMKNKLSSINNITVLGGNAGIKDSLVNGLIAGSGDSSSDSEQVLSEDEGNTAGNLKNGGFVVEKNGWIYYIKNGNKIYRIKTDGTQETKITDVKNARALNVVNNNLYYVGDSNVSENSNTESDSISIYKVSTGGSYGTTLVSEDEESFGKGYPYMKVIGDYAFYSPNLQYISKENASLYDNFYRINVDNRDSKQTSGEYLRSLAVQNGCIYFTTMSDNRIRKMPTSGNKKSDGTLDNKEVDLGLKGRIIDVIGDYIYYSDVDGNTYKIREDGTEKTKIVSIPDQSIIYGNWVYYVVPGSENLYQLHKMKIDGTQDTGLNAYKVEGFSITGDWIYYRNSGSGNIYRIKLDGTAREEFPDKVGIKKIDNINVKIKRGDSYHLPTAVSARMSDDSNEYFSVQWDKINLDTSETGTQEFYGTIDGYSSKVKLTIEIGDN